MSDTQMICLFAFLVATVFCNMFMASITHYTKSRIFEIGITIFTVLLDLTALCILVAGAIGVFG